VTYNPKVNDDPEGWMRVHDATLEQAIIALAYATTEDEARKWLIERGYRLYHRDEMLQTEGEALKKWIEERESGS